MSMVTVAATQMACSWDRDANMALAEKLIREAATRGAQVVLLQELFETPYFCNYHKSHIPESPGYHEKFYFSPGDTGFRVFNTRYAKLGVAICWDQWFPEAARSMALMGAEMLLYPTAIGSEPQDASIDSSGHWQRTMQGHAAANIMPVVASNRIGTEKGEKYTMTFYGSSFITSPTGEKLAEADRENESVLTASFDLDEVRRYRQAWGVFRDRRPDLYYPLLSLDGRG